MQQQKRLISKRSSDSLEEDTKSNLSTHNDVVMDLATPKDTHDPKEQHLISRYIDKAFNAVKDADSAAALLEQRINK